MRAATGGGEVIVPCRPLRLRHRLPRTACDGSPRSDFVRYADEIIALGKSRKDTLSEFSLAGVPSDWLQWVASIVFPALACGAFVRYNVSHR